jgi:outer membrane biosynthesis protein TonB
MTCSFCGTSLPAAARFCLQCGERNPAAADSVSTAAAGALTYRSRSNVAIVVGAVVVGLALIAFTYWQFVLPPAPTVTSSVTGEVSPTPSATPAPTTPAAPPPVVETSPPPPAPAAKASDTPRSPVAEPTRPVRERVVRPSASPKPAPAREERRATSPSTTESVPEPSMVTAGPLPDTSKAPRSEERASSETRPIAQAAPEARPTDRWGEMARELAVCEQKGALTKVFCVDRVRWRYCGDYWNKVPQCMVTKP